MSKNVCIFCASSNRVKPEYLQAAETFGRLLAEAGCGLVFGGGKVGLMGAAARGARQNGGKVIGVIPKILMRREIAYVEADELVVTRDLFERKAVLIDRSDGFAILPGGFGTLDELLEVITLKQLKLHQKPIGFLNIEGYFEGLFAFFEHLARERSAPASYRSYYDVFPDVHSLAKALVA